MKKQRLYIFLALMFILLVLILKSDDENTWIKDEKGIWIKQGDSSTIPNEVLAQQMAITRAKQFFQQEKIKNANLSSQCLGTFQDYAIDLVNFPRTQQDDLPENQCYAYREGRVRHFIELDKEGNIVRVR